MIVFYFILTCVSTLYYASTDLDAMPYAKKEFYAKRIEEKATAGFRENCFDDDPDFFNEKGYTISLNYELPVMLIPFMHLV